MKKTAEPEQHRLGVGDDLAYPATRQKQRQARPDRQQHHPQQQRPLLRGPDRRSPIERRRRRARAGGDDVVGEVRAHERDVEDHERDRGHRGQRVHRAPPRVDPLAPAARASAVQRGPEPVQAAAQTEDQQDPADVAPSAGLYPSVRARRSLVLGGALGRQRVGLADKGRRSWPSCTVTSTGRPWANGIGDLARVADRNRHLELRVAHPEQQHRSVATHRADRARCRPGCRTCRVLRA